MLINIKRKSIPANTARIVFLGSRFFLACTGAGGGAFSADADFSDLPFSVWVGARDESFFRASFFSGFAFDAGRFPAGEAAEEGGAGSSFFRDMEALPEEDFGFGFGFAVPPFAFFMDQENMG